MATSTTALTKDTVFPAVTAPNVADDGSSLRISRLQAVEVALDVATSFVAIELSYRIAHLMQPHLNSLGTLSHFHMITLFMSMMLAVLLDRAGAYRIGGSLLGVRETACILEAVAYESLLLVPYVIVVGSQGKIVIFCITPTMLAILLIAQKQSYCALLFNVRSLRADLLRVAVYGNSENATAMMNALLRSPKSRLLPTLCFSDMQISENGKGMLRKASRVSVHATEHFSEDVLRAENISHVVIASPIAAAAQLKRVLEESERAGARILYGADPHTYSSSEIEYFELDGTLLYRAHTVSPRYLYNGLKRLIDLTVAALLLVSLGYRCCLRRLRSCWIQRDLFCFARLASG